MVIANTGTVASLNINVVHVANMATALIIVGKQKTIGLIIVQGHGTEMWVTTQRGTRRSFIHQLVVNIRTGNNLLILFVCRW